MFSSSIGAPEAHVKRQLPDPSSSPVAAKRYAVASDSTRLLELGERIDTPPAHANATDGSVGCASAPVPSTWPRRRRWTERSGESIEHALELLKQFRESGESARQEAQFCVPSLELTVTVFYHKDHKPLKGIIVNGEASFTTFSKFRDWISLRRERAACSQDDGAREEGFASGSYTSREPSSMGSLSFAREAGELGGECAQDCSLRTPSPSSLAALLPTHRGSEAGPAPDRAAPGAAAAGHGGGGSAELFDASTALLLLARNAPR